MSTKLMVDWKSPDTIPEVDMGTEKQFWIAVEAATPNPHPGTAQTKVFTFLALYQNRPLEADEDGEFIDDDYLVTPCGDPHESIGWVSCKAHCEFDDYYEGIDFNEYYKLLGWAEYSAPEFTDIK